MKTFSNFSSGFRSCARAQALGLVLALASAAACAGNDGQQPTNSAGAGTGGAALTAGSAATPAAGASTGGVSTSGNGVTGGQGSGGTAGQSTMGGHGGLATAGQSSGGAGGAAGTAGMAGGNSGGGGSGGGGSGGAGACPHVQLKGSDFCTIGDSWIQLPGNQVTTLENHLKTAGVIPQADHFDRREVSGSTLSSIIKTYDDKPANCKILVMDGGGIDLFTTAAGNQAAIDPVVEKFEAFLAKVKSDGYVQHIIYSLYPVIPSTRNLNVNMKPGFSAACAASQVDCHLVDLEPLFMGQHFASDNTHSDNAGGVIIGDAWWKAMRENCIAQ